MVDDELAGAPPPRGRSSWTGLHRSSTARGDRLASRRDRPPPNFDDLPDHDGPGHDGLDADGLDADGLDAARPEAADTTVGSAVLPAQPDGPGYGDGDEHAWLDGDAGPVVRPYTLTGGRSRPFTSGLGLLTHVEALYAPEADLVSLQPEQRTILSLTRTALSLAELAARLDLPVGVVRVLIGDLLQANLVSTFEADAAIRAPDDHILQAVIDGLRAL
jgi:hypothetical protein